MLVKDIMTKKVVTAPSNTSIGKAKKIIACLNKLGVGIKILWTIAPSTINKNDIIIQLDTEDATKVITELQSLGYSTRIRPR